MHGAGNRFLLHFGDTPPKVLLRGMENVDGVLLVQEDEQVDVHMRVFNADGSEAQQCGNGLRCVALHLVRSHWVESTQVVVRTLGGTHTCIVHEKNNEVEVSLCIPKLGPESCNVHLPTLDDLPDLVFVNMGNPNAVLWTNDDPIEVREQWGDVVANHAAFIEGMNLHVARRDGKQYATCASFERGVGSTLASGTGGASVFVAIHSARTESKEPFYVSSLGGTLSYRYDAKGLVVMTGPAGYV